METARAIWFGGKRRPQNGASLSQLFPSASGFLTLSGFASRPYERKTPSAAEKISQTRIDVLFHFEYHPLGFSKGVQGMMLRTSRCFARIFFQLGGPDALQAVERFLFLYLADFFFLLGIGHLAEKLSAIALARRSPSRARQSLFHAIGKSGPSAHNLRGKVAVRCVAAG
jgi:hypothetical protein